MPQSNKTYWKHGICLISILILGNTVITFPSGPDAYCGIYALLAAVIPSIIIFSLCAKIRTENKADLLCGRWGRAVAIPTLILPTLGIAITVGDYNRFIDTMRLPNTSIYVIAGIFVALSFLLGLAPKKVIYLFSLVGTAFTVVITLIMLVFSIPNIRLEYLKELTRVDPSGIFRQAAGVFIQSFGFCVLLAFIGNSRSSVLKQQYFGLFLGASLLGICFFNVLSVLGQASKSLEYPYIAVSEMVSVGRIFTRLEGLSYAVYFICALIKTALLIKVSFKIASAVHRNFKKSLYFLLPLVSLYGISGMGGNLAQNSAVNIIMLIIELLLPITLYATVKLKGKEG